MIRLADALNAVAEHARVYADITPSPLRPGHPPTNEEMDTKRDAVRQVSSEIAALAQQARVGRVQRSEIEALTARLVEMGAVPPMEMSLALVDALAAESR